MSRWPRAQIRHLARLGTGHTPSRSIEEYWRDCEIPWLTLADVGQLRDGTVDVISSTNEEISKLGVANSSAVVHPAGTVAMSRTASVGYSCILGVDMATSQDYVTWRCGPRLHPRFLLWVLRGEREEIIARMQGSTHKTIYMPDVEQMSTPLPPIEKQREIADYLDTETARIDALVAKKRRMIELLDERQVAIADHCLWRGETVRLKHVASLLPGYAFSSNDFGTELEGVRLLRGTNVGVGKADWTDSVSLGSTGTEFARYRLENGDVVLGMDRPFIKAGTRVFVVGPAEEGALLVQRVCRIRPNADHAAQLIATAIRSPRFAAYIESDLTGVSVPHLSDEQIGNFHVPAACATGDIGLVDQLETSAAPLRTASSRLHRQINLLSEHRQALITSAVTGELEISVAA